MCVCVGGSGRLFFGVGVVGSIDDFDRLRGEGREAGEGKGGGGGGGGGGEERRTGRFEVESEALQCVCWGGWTWLI